MNEDASLISKLEQEIQDLKMFTDIELNIADISETQFSLQKLRKELNQLFPEFNIITGEDTTKDNFSADARLLPCLRKLLSFLKCEGNKTLHIELLSDGAKSNHLVVSCVFSPSQIKEAQPIHNQIYNDRREGIDFYLFKRMAEAMNGIISIHENILKCRIPCEQGNPVSSNDALDLSKIKALLLEDNSISKKLFTNLFQKLNIHADVITVTDEFSDLWNNGEPYDILVVRPSLMPETISTLKTGHPQTPVIAIVNSGEESKIPDLLEKGFDDTIIVPLSPEKLTLLLRKNIRPKKDSSESKQVIPETDYLKIDYLEHLSNHRGTIFINIKELVELGGNDSQFTNEIIGSCLNNITEEIARLRAGLQNEQIPNINDSIEKLNFSSTLLGARPLEGQLNILKDIVNKKADKKEWFQAYDLFVSMLGETFLELIPGYEKNSLSSFSFNDVGPDLISFQPPTKYVSPPLENAQVEVKPELKKREEVEERLNKKKEELGIKEIHFPPVGINKTPRVLIAEDDPSISKILQFRLKKEGFDVIVSSNGKEAIERISNESFELIITDLMMPFYNGLEVVSIARNKLNIKVPIIILSAVEQEETVVEAFKIGANDFITKPFSPNELAMRVNKYIKKPA